MKISQILSSLSAISNIPVTLYESSDTVFYFPNMTYLPKLAGQELEALRQKRTGECHAVCLFTDDLLCYGLIDMADAPGQYAVCGPVSAIDCDNRRAQRILKRYGLPTTEAGLLLSYFKDTATCSLLRFSDFLMLADYTLNHESLAISQLLPEGYQGEEEMLSSPPTVSQVVSTPHDAGAYERQLYSLLRFGKYQEMVSFLTHVNFTGNQGSLAGTLLRHQKNMVISSATLASRAAVDGGLDYDTAMTLADSYIQKVELAPDRAALLVLHKNMLKTYTRMVAEKRSNNPNSALATKVSSYVEQHLTDPISVQDLANVLELNRSYLSSQFKKETGINLNDYINRMKIDEATRLLLTTDRSVADIASLLAFSSQSYFQAVFKKQIGMTPAKYRAKGYPL